jgi:hypothetical protein
MGERIDSGCYEAGRERGRLILVGGGAATASLTTLASFDRDRNCRLEGAVWVFAATSIGAANTTGVTAGGTAAFGFRPNPSALAIVERRSE